MKTELKIEVITKAIGNVEGKSADEIKELLVTKGKVPFSKVAAIYKELGFTRTRSGYAADFYDLLRAKPMTDAVFESWVAAGSDNVKRSKAHYDQIRILANDIHNAK